MARKRKFTDAAAAYVKKLFRGSQALPSAGTTAGKNTNQSAVLLVPANVEAVRKDVTLNDLWDLLLQFMQTFEAFSSDLKKRQIIQLAMANTDAFAFEFSEKEVLCKNKDQCHSLLVEMLVAFREEDVYKFDRSRLQFLDGNDKGYADEEGKDQFQEKLHKALEALLGEAPGNTYLKDGRFTYPEVYCNLERFTYAMNHVHLHTFEYKEQVEAPTCRSTQECSDMLRKILMMFNSGGTFEVPKNAYIHEEGGKNSTFDGQSKNNFVEALEKALFNLLGEAAKKTENGSNVSLCLETK